METPTRFYVVAVKDGTVIGKFTRLFADVDDAAWFGLDWELWANEVFGHEHKYEYDIFERSDKDTLWMDIPPKNVKMTESERGQRWI